jgi:DNA ligase-1
MSTTVELPELLLDYPLMYKISKTGKFQVWRGWLDKDKVIVQFGTEGGKGQQKSYKAKQKNIGKANETTGQQQASLELTALYEKQEKNKHYRYTKEEAQVIVESCIIPMKIINYKDHYEKVKYPCYVSIKANGSRAMFKGSEVISKAGIIEDFKVEHIQQQIEQLSSDVDGEVYRHGWSLQRIQSARNKPNTDTPELGLVIFDIPTKDSPIEDRVASLRRLRKEIHQKGLNSLTVHVPKKCHDEEHLNYIFNHVTPDWEGVVIWNVGSYYEFGVRSNKVLKWKPRYDAEAKVVEVTEDKNGNGILHLLACDRLNNVPFKCMMKVNRRDGDSYPRDLKSMKDLCSQWITFSYEELSDDGIPTKPVGECPRECDPTGEPLE